MSTESSKSLAQLLESIKTLVGHYDEQYFEEIMQQMFKDSLYAYTVMPVDGESLGPRGELYFALIEIHKQMCHYSKSTRK